MLSSIRGILRLGLLTVWGIAIGASSAQAQSEAKEDVRFVTVDNVTIVGSYYKGKNKNSSCVIMLHALFSDQTKGDWDKLARDIREKFGYAVLTFDFRGHGKSTDVTPSFWDFAFNKIYIKGGKAGKQTIDVKEFSPGYYPALINDITAARYFLDQKNDAGECNSSSIMVVGAEDAAPLGMLWIATEWLRDTAPRQPNPLFPLAPPVRIGPARLAGGDIKSAIWLTFSQPKPQLYRGSLPMTSWATNRGATELRDNVPQVFLYGSEDKAGATMASYVYSKVLRADVGTTKSPKPANTFEKGVKGTKLAGIELIKAAETMTLINAYVDRTIEKQTAVWSEKDSRSQQLYPPPLDRFGFSAYLKPPGVR